MSPMTKEDFLKIAGRFLPPEAVDFVFYYVSHHDFSFIITSPRLSKKGDFKFSPSRTKRPVITVNGDLCTYEFLLTFIHELAHFFVYLKYPVTEKAHGKQWHQEYELLLKKAIENIDLPEDIVNAWMHHLAHTKSSDSIDEELTRVFRKYSASSAGTMLVADLMPGDKFVFCNDIYRIESFARTRARCTLIANDRVFLINKLLGVTPL